EVLYLDENAGGALVERLRDLVERTRAAWRAKGNGCRAGRRGWCRSWHGDLVGCGRRLRCGLSQSLFERGLRLTERGGGRLLAADCCMQRSADRRLGVQPQIR